MATKSILKQIIDEFLEELSKNKSIESHQIESLKELLSSGDINKEEIVKLLKEEEKNENTRA